ncbi:MAG: AMP-binding protein [Nitrospirota bacterium]|nr:AMP-binding protein [Nitrospirota bacterium]
MLFKYLSDWADTHTDKILVTQGSRTVTYGEVARSVMQIATFFLKQGVRPGDRICIVLDNSPEYISSYIGVHRAGGIAVAVCPQYSPFEFRKIFNDCLPSAVIVDKKYVKHVLDAVSEGTSIQAIIIMEDSDVQSSSAARSGITSRHSNIRFYSVRDVINTPDCKIEYPVCNEKDVASIIYTSGTTGEPKGVMLSNENLMINARSIIEYLQLTEKDRIMGILPFYYSYGTSLLTTHIIAGGSIVLENSFMYPNQVLDRMFAESVTGFAGVPSTFAILLNRSNIRKYTFPSLRYITQAGGAMSPLHAKEISEILPGADIFIMYGQTEATARLTYLEPRDFHYRPWSIGKAIPGVDIELIKEDGTIAKTGEVGEIVARGGNIMVGYWNRPEETDKVLKDGRLYTGDLAVRDEEGFLKIISRRSDIIKSGAHRINPREIEEVILELPEVHEVAVAGKDDAILGMVIKACIVLKDGQGLDARKVQRHCHNKLAPFKLPKEVVFVDELPKTGTGKIRRHLINDLGAGIGSTG